MPYRFSSSKLRSIPQDHEVLKSFYLCYFTKNTYIHYSISGEDSGGGISSHLESDRVGPKSNLNHLPPGLWRQVLPLLMGWILNSLATVPSRA